MSSKNYTLMAPTNGEAENFMKPLTKAAQSSHAEGRDWRKDLFRFLLNYRATPHSTTGMAPARLLFNRNIVTKLPELDQDYDHPDYGPENPGERFSGKTEDEASCRQERLSTHIRNINWRYCLGPAEESKLVLNQV